MQISDEMLESCATQVAKRVEKDARRGAKRAWREQYNAEDLLATARSAVWFCAENGDCDDEATLVNRATRMMYQEFNDDCVAVREYRNHKHRKLAEEKYAFSTIPTLPWGVPCVGYEGGNPDTSQRTIGVMPPSLDEPTYDDRISKISIRGILKKLIRNWRHPDLALAWVLFHGFGYSIPSILSMFGIEKEEVDAQVERAKKERAEAEAKGLPRSKLPAVPPSYGAIRKRMWQHLNACKIHAEAVIVDEDVEALKNYFKP